jgi:hypothetical protein
VEAQTELVELQERPQARLGTKELIKHQTLTKAARAPKLLFAKVFIFLFPLFPSQEPIQTENPFCIGPPLRNKTMTFSP